MPKAGETVVWPFGISGWAVDLAASSSTGVDAVHVWAYPETGSAPIFVGSATLGIRRPDVAAFLGSSQFEYSGFRIDAPNAFAPGGYTFRVFAHSTVSGTFNSVQSIPLTVRIETYIGIGMPEQAAHLTLPVSVSGWAVNTGDSKGTGVDAIHVWAFPNDGAGATFLGAASLGSSRPDVASFFSVPSWEASGFVLESAVTLPDGGYTLRVYARNTTTGRFDTFRERNVWVGSDVRTAVGEPTPGETVFPPFVVSGWAVDLASGSGTGVDTVHVWAFPKDGSPAFFLGSATYGLSRPDVASYFQDPRMEPSGFRLEVTGVMIPGEYTLRVYPRSTVTGAFSATNSRSVDVKVWPSIGFQPFVTGLANPVGIESAGDGSGRLFIVLQGGKILIHDGTGLRPTPFLDLTSLVSCCGERGLLGLAFHPDYAVNGRFFVNYTDTSGQTVVQRYSVSSDPDVADPSSAITLLQIPQPYSNHNGGALEFGPDGFLYVAVGDGGSGGDPLDHGQNLSTLLGSLLRIDVDSGAPYGVPATNPFVGIAGARPEIWAYGLRNPWRFSFDRLNGDLFIGDVGQNEREEIDREPAGGPGGNNYGWRLMEGSSCFNPSDGCNDGSLVLPVLEYTHSSGCSVTGGYAYRGSEFPGLQGAFIYGDFCSGRIWAGFQRPDDTWVARQILDTDFLISSFGESDTGELFLVHYSQSAGAIYRLVRLP